VEVRGKICVLLFCAHCYPSPTRRARRIVGGNRRTITCEQLVEPYLPDSDSLRLLAGVFQARRTHGPYIWPDAFVVDSVQLTMDLTPPN
jgi:hypothetical protein